MAKLEEFKELISEKVVNLVDRVGTNFPGVSVDNNYIDNFHIFWTNSFFCGILLEVYKNRKLDIDRITLDSYLDRAQEIEKFLDVYFINLNDFMRLQHDCGFVWGLSSMLLANTIRSDESNIRCYRAASIIASRFNIKGQYIQAWNFPGYSIIDTLMNLPLLYYVSHIYGQPRFEIIADAHIETVMKYFFMDDGSVHHIVEFDPYTGEKIQYLQGQGYSKDSAWARGQAWAINGLVSCYEFSKKDSHLEYAMKVADYFIEHLPEDFIPVWDFRAPESLKDIKDTSAASCAADGLYKLYQFTGEEKYLNCCKSTIENLCNYYLISNKDKTGIISKATANYNNRYGVNTAIIYGDYYFIKTYLNLID